MKPEFVALSAKIAAHLTQQQARALNEEKQCVYKAPDGKMCAVGCLLGNEYMREFEGKSGASFSILSALGKAQGIELGPYDWARPLARIIKSWQIYHDTDLLDDGQAYEAWVQGKENAVSPNEFHNLLMAGKV